jgi:hypothetical protein
MYNFVYIYFSFWSFCVLGRGLVWMPRKGQQNGASLVVAVARLGDE